MTPDDPSPLLVFDFSNAAGLPVRLVFANPVQVVTAFRSDDVRFALAEVERGVEKGLFAGGYIAYEAAPAFDPSLSVKSGNRLPLLWFGLFREPAKGGLPETEGHFSLSGWKAEVDESRYRRDIETIRAAIARGETYQVNYTIRLFGRVEGDDWALYQSLVRTHRPPYAAYLRLGRHRILSASPELFFRMEGDSITVRPMKGTAPRGRWVEEDDRLRSHLRQSDKNRAENVMIVDLLRNDLGKIAQTGSVRVRSLFDVESYPTVFQMTSTLEAKLRPDLSVSDVLDALFPSGSVTGAPKVRTMKWIAELEDSPREVYCGTIGLIAPGRRAVFNVAIRTLILDHLTKEAVYGTGAGITWDSTAEGEFRETLEKARIVTEPFPDFKLLETIRLDAGGYVLLDRHLQRLMESARYFGFPLDAEKVQNTLEEHARRYPGQRRRVRLTAAQDGEIRVDSAPLTDAPDGPVPVALADRPVSSSDRFLYHKTTRRDPHDAARARRPDVFDVLLWNEREEATEFTIGNLVAEIDGEKKTPPLECGLLAGTFRNHLLEQGVIAEGRITLRDLRKASRLWLINSVRGWVPVRLVD
ncbi:MAG: aminodeoxychorismate synthase component I [Alicyclobacillaceae bacterium]|nr:aminodeoxychorismate synthase component I [Alicyclobacillaceae bacterium]